MSAESGTTATTRTVQSVPAFIGTFQSADREESRRERSGATENPGLRDSDRGNTDLVGLPDTSNSPGLDGLRTVFEVPLPDHPADEHDRHDGRQSGVDGGREFTNGNVDEKRDE